MIKLLIKADFGQFWDDPVPKSKFEVKVSETKGDPFYRQGLEEEAISLLHSSKGTGPHGINSIS